MDHHCSSSQKTIRIVLISLYICMFWLVLAYVPSSHAQTVSVSEVRQLDRDFQQLATQIYEYFAKANRNGLTKIMNIKKLEQQTRALIRQQQAVKAISLLKLNLNTIKENIDHKSIFYFTALLLENNEWHTADRLYKYVETEGDKSLLSILSFHFARYFRDRDEWQKCIDYLTGTIDDLPIEDANYARLLYGSSLQQLKQHRKSLLYYKAIPVTSKFYPYAQLNTAIAYIRQGWWTDASIVINQLLASQKASKTDEMVNRLYLVLGYSLLQKEYYRDSREAFRNIGLESQYTNRALLGIGLAAANQNDHIGALNTLAILKDKKTYDLSVDESYMLLAYVYTELKQQMTASASYSEAINYYEDRISNIEKIINTQMIHEIKNIKFINNTIVIAGTDLAYDEYYPMSFLKNIGLIKMLQKELQHEASAEANGLKIELQRLNNKHERILIGMSKVLLDQRKEHLKSYLNQSRYGLAKLYDSSFISEQNE